MMRHNKGKGLVFLAVLLLACLFAWGALADPATGTTLEWTDTGNLIAGQTTYNLRKDTAGTIVLHYANTQATGDDTVLVVSCLEYGSAFKTLIDHDINPAIAESAWLNPEHTKIALRLEPRGESSSLTIQFETITKSLTDQQCADWMDGRLQSTGLVAQAYQHAGSLDTAENGTPITRCAFEGLTPAVYGDAEDFLSNIYGYEVGVSSFEPVTNLMLNDPVWGYGGTGTQDSSSNKSWGDPSHPYLYYKLSTAHADQMPLVEITGIKVYVPDNASCLSLAGIRNITTNDPRLKSGLRASSFTEGYRWGDWVVGARQTDTNGKDYYLITPPAGTRVFNNASNDGARDAVYAGMVLTWQTSSDLPYSSTEQRVMKAKDTVVLYKTPPSPGATPASDPDEFEHPGPILNVWKRVDSNTIFHGYYQYHKKNMATLASKTVGSTYTNVFTYTTNSYRIDRNNAGIHTEYVPTYDGPIEQTYEFPYEIQPTRIYIGRMNYMSSGNIWEMYSDLADVAYTLSDDTEHHLSADQIADINSKMQTVSGTNGVWANLANYSDTNPVKKVTIKWNKLCLKLHRATNTQVPIYNSNIGEDGNGIIAYSQLATAVVQFTYRVSTTHANGTLVENGYLAHVLYDFKTNGSVSHYPNGQERMVTDEAQWIWLHLKQPEDVLLYAREGRPMTNGNSAGNSLLPQLLDGNQNTAVLVPDLGLIVGIRGERQDILKNPEIRLHIEESSKRILNSVGRTGAAMTDQERLLFFSGRFTATKALSGWVISYDLYNKTTKQTKSCTYTVGQLTRDTTITLPHEEDEYFTALLLKYSGAFNTGHPSDNPKSFLSSDNAQFLDLMRNMMLRNVKENPFTGQPFGIAPDYSYSVLQVRGSAIWDNCICMNHVHDPSGKGQQMQPKPDTGNRLPYCAVCADQKIALEGKEPPVVGKNDEHIYQGESTDTTLDFNVVLNVSSSSYSTGTGVSTLMGVATSPWDIAEAAYIELTDPTFMIDPSASSFYGEPLDGGNITYNTVVHNGKMYLCIRFKDGFIRNDEYERYGTKLKKFSQQTGRATLFNNPVYPSMAGTIALKFNTAASTEVGIHYPVGKVYLNFSQLLDDYAARLDPSTGGIVGAKDGYTKYVFIGSNLVADTLGFSTSAATGPKLWEYDFSQSSATPYQVNVLYAGGLNVNVFPGKTGVWNYDRVTEFQTHEKDELRALVTIHGPDTKPVYDLNAYICIPRIDQPVDYVDENGNRHTMRSNYDMYLRGLPFVLTQSATGVGPVTYAYTTEKNPSATSTWHTLNAATTANWSKAQWDTVRGIRIHVASMDMQTKVDVQLDLRCDGKETLNILSAYSGGSYDYKLDSASAPVAPQVFLGVAEYRYNNYDVTFEPTSRIWYDLYDENGIQGGDGVTGETAAQGVTVTLYDTDGETPIHSAVSQANGGFTLQSWKNDAGQRLVITVPDSWEGNWKLTRQSGEAITAALTDSDFDRTNNTLILPQLPHTGGIRNVSAGLVRLPEVTATDVTVYAGQSGETTATLKDYLGMNLPGDSYNLEFAAAADSAIARVNAKTEIIEETQASDTRSRTTAVTGLRGGQTTATVKTVNRLGDEVTAIYTITVKSLPLTISKQVAGVGADEQLAFQFEVTVPSLANQTMMASTGNLVFDADGKVTFALKHGESLTLPQIPYGASYTVTELPVAEYAASAQITGDTLTDDTHDGNAILTGAGVNTIADSWFGPSDRNTVITFTNTHVPSPVEFTVSKVWQDDNNRDGKRPNQVEIILHADNKDVAKATLNAANGWSYTFKDLPKYGSTALITYTASEVLPTGYTLTKQESATGAVLTNSYTPGKTSVQVEKIWEDDDNRDNLRPKHVIVELLADGKPVQEMVLEELSNWEGIFNELNAMASGKDIVYTVREKDVPKEYTAAEPVYANGTWHITNTHKPAATEIQVTKVWDDKDDLAGMRPDSVTLYLNANGLPVEGKEYQLTAKDNWKYTFPDLPVFENGKEITYTVTEDMEELKTIGYELETTQGEGTGEVVLTNKYDPEHTSLAVLKVWDDGNDQDGLRPESVTIELLADGEVFQEETLNAEGGWGANISELPKHKDGKEITYTVREKEVPEGYAASSPAYKNGAWHITNAHVPAIISIPVTKEWVDEDDAAKARPEKIIVRLHADGIEINSVELTADTEWKTVFEDLPVYKDGDEIVYTVTEEHVPGYTHHIDEDTYTITNTYNPTLTDVEVEKTWDMDGHKDVEHPDSVTVRLLADGEDTGITLELNAENKWFGMFEKLELMKDEKPIVYTVEEIEIENFVSEVVVENDYEFLIVNKYVPTEPKPEPEPVPVPTEPPYIYSFTFTKIWQGDTEDSIEWKLYTSDGGAARKSFRKSVISENEWHYEGWFPVDGDYYLIEDVPEGYKVRYENVGVHAGETDRLYNGGTMINYKIPKTGDDANSALWIALAAVSAGALALLWIRRESTHNNL